MHLFQDHVSTRLSRRIEEPLQKRVDDKTTQKETKLANTEDERRFMIRLAHKNIIEIPNTFFETSPEMLQIEEAKETNNQAELATVAHES